LIGVLILGNGHIALGDFFVGHPNQDRTGWIATVKRVKQVTDTRGLPDIFALYFGQGQFATLNHADQLFNVTSSFAMISTLGLLI
jgi:hypothetical protein